MTSLKITLLALTAIIANTGSALAAKTKPQPKPETPLSMLQQVSVKKGLKIPLSAIQLLWNEDKKREYGASFQHGKTSPNGVDAYEPYCHLWFSNAINFKTNHGVLVANPKDILVVKLQQFIDEPGLHDYVKIPIHHWVKVKDVKKRNKELAKQGKLPLRIPFETGLISEIYCKNVKTVEELERVVGISFTEIIQKKPEVISSE